MSLTSPSESQAADDLLAKARAGDPDAVDDLCGRYHERLVTVARNAGADDPVGIAETTVIQRLLAIEPEDVPTLESFEQSLFADVLARLLPGRPQALSTDNDHDAYENASWSPRTTGEAVAGPHHAAPGDGGATTEGETIDGLEPFSWRPLRHQDDDHEPEAPPPPKKRRWKLVVGFLVVVGLALGGLWFAYDRGSLDGLMNPRTEGGTGALVENLAEVPANTNDASDSTTAVSPSTTAADDPGDLTMTGLDFTGQDLREADFSNRVLNGVDFTGADLRRADFSGSTITDSSFADANLTGAALANAAFQRAEFEGANVSGADFTGSTFDGKRMAGWWFQDDQPIGLVGHSPQPDG